MDLEQENKERQIWQRVLQQERPKETLRELIRTSGELAAVYRQLRGALTGQSRDLADQLYTEELATMAALRGLGRLMGREGEALKLWQPGKEPVAKQLEKAYHRTRRCMVDYAARTAEPEFGVVFQTLEHRAQKQCARIVQLLGSIG